MEPFARWVIPQGFQQTFRELFTSSCKADSSSMSVLLTPAVMRL